MQEDSAVECSHGARLKNLRTRLQLEWNDLAARLEISPSMCYQVARGAKKLSDLAVFRLEDLERKSGLLKDYHPDHSAKTKADFSLKKDKISISREDADEVMKIAVEAKELLNRVLAILGKAK